jgi:predicted PurR-regulated permease PerM
VDNLSGRLVIYLVALASIFVILFGIRETATILNPILLAIVITITVLPVPGLLTKRGLPGWLALVLTIGLVVLVLGLIIATVFFSITKLSTELPTYYSSTLQRATEDFSLDRSRQVTTQPLLEINTLGPLATNLLASVGNLLVQFGLALVIFFFMISAAISLPAPSRVGLDPNAAIIQRVAGLTEDVRKYVSVLTLVNFMVGFGDTIFLLFLGVDYAVLWGLLAWFMGYIPSIGFIIALIPPVLMAYAQYGVQSAIVVLIGYILINGSVQNFIQPKIMGQRLQISPVIVFVGLFVWGFLLGGIGAILAVPLTLLVLIVMENFEGTRAVALLMRYTGDSENADQKKAMESVKGWWNKTKRAFSPDKDSSSEN